MVRRIAWVGVVLATAASAFATQFPLQVSPDERHLETADGTPFLVIGDTAWSLIAQLKEDEILEYLDDRRQRGFNAIIVNLIEHKFADKATAKIDGVKPFLADGDFNRPNPEYFDFAVKVVEKAGERGISVWLCPAYLGWGRRRRRVFPRDSGRRA